MLLHVACKTPGNYKYLVSLDSSFAFVSNLLHGVVAFLGFRRLMLDVPVRHFLEILK